VILKFLGDFTTETKTRPEGRRVKHRMKRNSVKMYDKLSVLRIETTINNPREFKVLKVIQTPEGRSRRWKPMNKGVANFWRFWQVGSQSNHRYLEALAQVERKGEAVQALESLCRSRTRDGKRYARFNPVTKQDCALFAAAMAGEHIINGFRNRDSSSAYISGGQTALCSCITPHRKTAWTRLGGESQGCSIVSRDSTWTSIDVRCLELPYFRLSPGFLDGVIILVDNANAVGQYYIPQLSHRRHRHLPPHLACPVPPIRL
jgi:hypothetical protein